MNAALQSSDDPAHSITHVSMVECKGFAPLPRSIANLSGKPLAHRVHGHSMDEAQIVTALRMSRGAHEQVPEEPTTAICLSAS